MNASTALAVADRIAGLDWAGNEACLDETGFAQTPPVFTPEECEQLAATFVDDANFRSTIDMRRYRFGDGEYKYFDAPLPDLIDEARYGLYPPLATVANRWAELLGEPDRFPSELDSFLECCHRAGQRRTTPLILRYTEGGHNTLHQDLYGEVAFPFQAVTALSRAGEDFQGGQFVLLEQRPRAQSRAHVLRPAQGAFVIFPTRERPNAGKTGYHRVGLRHGVSTVTAGERVALGVIFHDAS